MKAMPQLFTSSGYAALQDPKTEDVIIEFLHARYMDVVRFVLRPNEKGRYDDVPFITTLIDSYYLNPGKFGQKRKLLG
jgi:hypothetical protein